MKVRITEKPRQSELDGMRLDGYVRGMVRDVSPLVGAWLITEGYADLELRRTKEEEEGFGRVTSADEPADQRSRRSRRRPAD